MKNPGHSKIINFKGRRKTHVATNPDSSNEKASAIIGSGRPRSKKEQIVQAAIKVFLENGYAGTSMNRVAAEADVIKATIYSHFKDKEELFAAIIEEVTFKRMAADTPEFEQYLHSLPPDEFVKLLTQKFKILSQSEEYRALLRVVIGESERFPELATLYVKTVILKGMELASGYFSKHKELKLNNPLATAHICCGSFVAWLIWQEILGGKNFKPLEFDDVVIALQELVDAKLAQDKDSK
ncbi:MAG: TetR family transcriptional regulator [Cyanobacteria bacterium DS2.3.42]|nr:TetR family transcriptional regulator [Cyanobacteria bacterium DS2.3.42]